ncbi:MAG: hypothetical protein MJ169_02090 [Treponema sp.]|nr:hypothetical protein [Treponema sp.]
MKKIFCLLLIAFFPLCVFAQYNNFGVKDSSEIRKEIAAQWFFADLDSIRQNNNQIRKNTVGESFYISLEEYENVFMVYVVPQVKSRVDVYDATGMHTSEEGVYPVEGQGAWLLCRDKKSGDPLYVRYYFTNTPQVYLEFHPYKNSCTVDLMIFGCFASKGVPLGIPFERVLTLSFSELQQMTNRKLPWKYTNPDLSRYDGSKVMMQTIRQNLKKIAFEEGAMYNEYGKSVSVFTGNPHICDKANSEKLVLSSCGFVKWVVDGLVYPVAGSYLKREPLLTETVHYKENGLQGTLQEKRRTSFSLDFTRNLAAADLSVRMGKTYLYKDSAVDVNFSPFSAVKTKNGIVNLAGYFKDSGYKPEVLKALFYVLAVSDPQYCYLGAFRQTDRNAFDRKKAGEGNAEIKVFNEACVFFPYFDTNGQFKIAVFYDGQEVGFDEIIGNLVKTGDSFVHLTRVKTNTVYYPQEKLYE